jgi:sugar phosphate isomerase/epimerase
MNLPRRRFLQSTAAGLGCLALPTTFLGDDAPPKEEKSAADEPLYRISLGEYSLHRALAQKKLDHLDFARTCKTDYEIDAAEYWNMPFKDKAADKKYLDEMKQRAEDAGVRSLLILVDGEGHLGDPDEAKRTKAVENHFRWAEAAQHLGCHSIRVNAHSRGTPEEQLKLVADGLRRLSELARPLKISVIVENHGGLSSDGAWVVRLMEAVKLPNCGTLPDFGNFGTYDRYQGTKELMPYATAVSAKSHDFDEKGNERRTDYYRMMKIVTDAGYHGYVGIEYEGQRLPEREGILATKGLLEKVRQRLVDEVAEG